MKTIAALVDFSDLTFKVLKQAHTMASAFQSRVIIMHMVAREPTVVDVGIASPVIMQSLSPEATQVRASQLLEMRDSLVKFGVPTTVQQLQSDSVEGLLAETEKLGADLIIMGSHHHSALHNLLIGSVTEGVLKRSKCPVLVVPSDDQAAATS